MSELGPRAPPSPGESTQLEFGLFTPSTPPSTRSGRSDADEGDGWTPRGHVCWMESLVDANHARHRPLKEGGTSYEDSKFLSRHLGCWKRFRLPLWFLDSEVENKFLHQVFPNHFVIPWLLVFGVTLATLLCSVIRLVDPYIIEALGWRESPMSSPELSYHFYVRFGVSFGGIVFDWVMFLLPRSFAVCLLRRSAGKEAVLSPLMMRILEFLNFVCMAYHLVTEDIALFVATMANHPGVFGWSGLLELGSPRIRPFLGPIGGMAICILIFPMRAVYVLVCGVTVVIWTAFFHIFAFAVVPGAQVSSLLSNLALSLIIPILLAVLASSRLSESRKLFVLKEKLTGHLTAVVEENSRLVKLLAHVIPERFLKVDGDVNLFDRYLLSSVSGVSVFVLDLASFTEWSLSNSSERVISHLHRFFSQLDGEAKRLGLMKLRQEGDSWIAVSLPHTGPDGIMEMLRMSLFALRISTQFGDESLDIRIGLGFTHDVGILVAWGTRMKSLDFMSSSFEEASLLEQSCPLQHVHLRSSTLTVLEWLPADVPNSTPTELGLCLNKDSLSKLSRMGTASTTDWPISLHLESCSDFSTGPSVASSLIPSHSSPSRNLVLWKDIRKTVEKKCCFSLSSDAPVTRLRSFLVLGCSFVVTVGQLVDLFTSAGWSPSLQILCSVLPSCFAVLYAVFALVFAFVPPKTLRHFLAIFSILVILLRITSQLFVVSLCEMNYQGMLRVLCWEFATPLLHVHLNIVLVVGFLVVPIPAMMTLFLSSNSIDPISPAFVEFGLDMSYYRVMYAFMTGPLSLLAALTHLRIARATREVEEASEDHESLLNSRSILISSFLPDHIRQAVARGISCRSLLSAHEASVGAVCFVQLTCAHGDLISRAGRINKQISDLDDVVIEFNQVIKIKSSSKTYLCVVQDGSLLDVIPLALRFLDCRNDRVELRIGCHAGERFSAGIIGRERWCFDVVGRPINTASRLANACSPNAIMCLEEIIRQDHCSVSELFVEGGMVQMKGMGERRVCILLPEKEKKE